MKQLFHSRLLDMGWANSALVNASLDISAASYIQRSLVE